jgi:hypothetical protein
MIMNEGLEKLWKKWGVAYIQVLFQRLPERTEKEHEIKTKLNSMA